MKLYKRPLKGLADLKREKVLLRYMRDEHTTDDLFSTEGLRRGRKKAAKQHVGDTDSPVSGILSMAMGLFGAKSAAGGLGGLLGGSPILQLAAKALPKKKIAGLAWEVVSGYLKWRAVEAGVWGVKQLVKGYKERKRFSREASSHHPIHRHGTAQKGARALKQARKKIRGLF